MTVLVFVKEGGIAERISRIIENALKSPHVPLQVIITPISTSVNPIQSLFV